MPQTERKTMHDKDCAYKSLNYSLTPSSSHHLTDNDIITLATTNYKPANKSNLNSTFHTTSTNQHTSISTYHKIPNLISEIASCSQRLHYKMQPTTPHQNTWIRRPKETSTKMLPRLILLGNITVPTPVIFCPLWLLSLMMTTNRMIKLM